MSIFVSIASYRDPETIPTIIDAYNKSKNKKEIRFGVLLQEDHGFSKKENLSSDINVDFLDYDWRESQGTCWARNTIQKLLFNNEDYYFQLDSHHRFCENWDEKLIELFTETQKRYPKPIIGGYCPGYIPKDDQNLEQKPMRIASFADFSDLGDLMFIPKVIKNYEKLQNKNVKLIKARFLSGHFIFAGQDFIKECLYDPNMYFRGEEITLSARAYTNGYDFFHPTTPIVWHEYIRAEQIKHWDDHTKGNGFIITSENRSNIGKQRARHLLGMEKNTTKFGKYGLGNKRSLHEYELYAGLNFSQKLVHKDTYDINDTSKEPYVMTEEEWASGMLNKYSVEFDIPNNYIPNLIDKNVNSLAIVLHDPKDNISYRKDIKKNDFKNLNTNILKVTGSMESKPHRVTLIPFLENKSSLPTQIIRSIRIANE